MLRNYLPLLAKYVMYSGITLSRFSVFTVERPTLDQFVLLSLMLHVLVIVLFGDTVGGGAKRGEKLWGALTVTVQSLLPDRGVALKLDRDTTTLQRAVADPRATPASPGITSEKRDRRASEQTERASLVEDVSPPAQASSFEMPPLISKDVEKAVTDFVVPKPSAERAYAPPTEQVPREALVAQPPVIVAPTIQPPVVVEPVAELIAPVKIERALVTPLLPIKPVELKPREDLIATPALQPEPPPAKIEREATKPIVSAPSPKPREVVQPATQPAAPTPSVPVTPIAPTLPPKPERERTQPIAAPAEPKTREMPAPAVPSPPALSESTQRVETAKTPKPEREVVAPVGPPVAATVAPSGVPAADNDIFRPRGEATRALIDTPGLAPAPLKTPGIDLDAVRRRAREITSDGTGPRTVFPFPGAPQQKPKSKEQQAFDKALKKNDCRDAYADMGLAAVVPLVLSAVREGGCKW